MISENIIASVAGEAHTRQLKFYNAREVYEGVMPAPLVDDDGAENTLDNIIVPACGDIVDKGVDFLFGHGVTFDVSEGYGDDAQAALETLWEDNRMPTRLVELATNGGIAGHAFLKFEPDTENAKTGAHKIVVIDPAYLDVLWNPNNVNEVWLYRIEYPTLGEDNKPVMYRQDIEAQRDANNKIVSWIITNYTAKQKDSRNRLQWLGMGVAGRDSMKWIQQGKPHNWPHEWAPIFECQNRITSNAFWGRSDIEQVVIDLNLSVNRLSSNTAKTLRHFAHPQTIVAGGVLPEDGAIGEPIEFEDPDTKMFNLEMQSDLGSSLAFLDKISARTYEAGNVPEIAKGKIEGNGQTSGIALKILYGPLMSVTQRKRLTYGDMLSDLIARVLEYMGYAPSGGVRGTLLVWPNPVPTNEKEDAETAAIDSSIGASRRSLLARRGMDADTEAENRLEEGRDDPAMRGMLDLFDGGANTPEKSAQTPQNTDG